MTLKYCGGCDPAYDRVEYWQGIRDAAGGAIQWLRPEEGGSQAILLICGCDRACPLKELVPPKGSLITVKNNRLPPGEVAAQLLSKDANHG